MSLIAVVTVVSLVVPLVCAAARPLGPRAGWIGAGVLAAATVAVGTLWVQAGEIAVEVPWIPALDVAVALRLDGLGALFAILVLGVGAIVLAYSTSYVTQGGAGFFGLMTAFAAAMLLLVLADDVVLMFVAWEITTICSYLLILQVGPRGRAPAGRALLITVAGGLSLLGAVALMAVRTGTTTLSAILAHPAWVEDPVFATTAAVLVAVAAMTKAAQFPFHVWLPDAMVAPAPVSAYLHAAAMVKAGIYLVMRFAGAASAAPVWGWLLVGAGVVSALIGGVFALQRSDLKELLAYSTISQLGLLVTLAGVATPLALRAAALHVIAHALFKAAGFLGVGALERRFGTRDLAELRGLARASPGIALALTLAAASMAGVPLMLGFVSKEYALEAVLGAGGGPGLVAAVGVSLAAVLTVAYSARIVWPVLAGTPTPTTPGSRVGVMTAAMGLLALAGTLLGPAVALLDGWVGPAASAAMGAPVEAGLSPWHGLNAALLVSAVALAAGVGLTVIRTRVNRVLDRRLFPVDGVDVVERLRSGVISGGWWVGRPTRGSAPGRHLLPALVVIGVVGAAGALAAAWPAGRDLWSPAAGTTRLTDLVLLALVATGVAAILRSRTRLAAVLAAGVVGFGVTLWFYGLGAADVALTQLLVEILTVVVLVIVLPRLPRGFAPRARRVAPRVLLALGAGAAATVGTLALTGHRELSRAGTWFVSEAEEATGGTNIVNTILVDFRALDTLGELAVLAFAALVLVALLDARRPTPRLDEHRLDEHRLDERARPDPVSDPHLNAVFLGVLSRVLVPVLLVTSLWLLLRGHNAPGGGFIGALVGAAALMLAYLAAPTDQRGRSRLPFLAVSGAGVVVAAATGLLGLLDGSYLRPLLGEVLDVSLTTALVFDVGVYLAVLGVLAAATSVLSPASDAERPADTPDDEAGPDDGPDERTAPGARPERPTEEARR